MANEPVDVANYLFGLTSEAQHQNATDCEHCGVTAVMFNPGNIAVQCHNCGMAVAGDPEHAEMRHRHLLTYLEGAHAQMGAVRPSGTTPPSDQVAHEIHQTLRPHPDEEKSYLSLEEKLAKLVNETSAETRAGTPDYVLARYLTDCLAAYGRAIESREAFYGRGVPETCPHYWGRHDWRCLLPPGHEGRHEFPSEAGAYQ